MNRLPLRTDRPASSVQDGVPGSPLTLSHVLYDSDGNPIDLTGKTVTIEITTAAGELHLSRSMTVDDATAGEVSIALTTLETTQAGAYTARYYVKGSGGVVEHALPAGPGVRLALPGSSGAGLSDLQSAIALVPVVQAAQAATAASAAAALVSETNAAASEANVADMTATVAGYASEFAVESTAFVDVRLPNLASLKASAGVANALRTVDGVGRFRFEASGTPDQILVFEADSDLTGTSGVWVRVESGGTLTADFTTLSAGATAASNTTALQGLFDEAIARGNATVVIPASTTGAAIPLNNIAVAGTGTEILNVRIEGQITSAIANPGSQTGILSFSNLKGVSVAGADVTYTGTYDPPTLAGNVVGVSFVSCDSVRLDSPRVRGASRHGGYISGCENVTVTGGDFQSNRQAGLLVVASDDIQIIGGHYHANGLTGDTTTGYGIAMPVSTAGNEARSISIVGAHANGNYRKGFDLHSGRRLLLSDFQAKGNIVGGVFAMTTLAGSYCEDIKIANGIVTGNLAATIESYGVKAGGTTTAALCNTIDIQNVTVKDTTDYGIQVLTGGVDSVSVTGCRVSNVQARTGAAVSQGITVDATGDATLVNVSGNEIWNARIHYSLPKGVTLQLKDNACTIRADDPHLDGVGTFALSTPYTVGQKVRGLTKKYGFVYECTADGTSDAVTEATWATTIGGTVVQGGATFTTIAIAPYDGYSLGNAGAGLGFDRLIMNGCHVDEGFERNHRKVDNITRLYLSNNTRGTYNMDPDPITLSIPIQTVGTSSSVTTEFFTLPAGVSLRVVAAGGRQLLTANARTLQVLTTGTTRMTIGTSDWAQYHQEHTYYNNGATILGLKLNNANSSIDMGGTVSLVISPGINL